jgi:hypothetical protein
MAETGRRRGVRQALADKTPYPFFAIVAPAAPADNSRPGLIVSPFNPLAP